MEPRRTLPRTSKPMALRIPPDLMQQIKEVGKIMGKADQEVIRLATEIGLEHLRRVNYNIASPILDASESIK